MYIYGKNVVKEKLYSDTKIHKAYISDKFSDKEIEKLLKEKNIKVKVLNSKVFDNKFKGLNQNIALEVDEIKTYDLDYVLNLNKKYPLIVILDHLEDPHNFGAIIRTSEALGVDAIIIPNEREVGINATVVKTSAGAVENIKIIRVASLNATISKLKDNGYWIVGTDMQGEDYTKIDYKMKMALIIGNEGKGMSKTLQNSSDYIAKIPMVGKINSLNASVSCGIILSEIIRQRSSYE